MNALELDASLQSEYPLHVVGIYTAFQPLTEPGSRLLLTRDGLLLEANNGVFRSVQPIAQSNTTLNLPYGEVPCGVTTVDQASKAQLPSLIQGFLQTAREACPYETMMLIVKAPNRALRVIYPSLNETAASLDYDLAQIEDDEHIILDVHSHGQFGACFSSTDDRDDKRFRGHLKASYVFGDMHQPNLSYIQRWVSRGHIFSQQATATIAANIGDPTPC